MHACKIYKDNNIKIGTIRIRIESEMPDDNGNIVRNAESMEYKTMNEKELMALFLQDEEYKKLVIRTLARAIEVVNER